MTGMPDDVRLLVAFDSPVGAMSPTYADLSDRLESFSCSFGRDHSTDACQPGQVSVTLDNSDGLLSPRNTTGPYAGRIKPMKRLKVEVQQTPFAGYVELFNGYIDGWFRTWPGGGQLSMTTVTATDYFKVLNRRFYSGVRPQESAAARIAAILAGVGIPAAQRAINTPGHASRTLVATTYANDNALSACQDAAFSDGGLFFQSPTGVLTFETYAARANQARSTAVQEDFGSGSPTDIAVEADLSPVIDDETFFNRVFVIAANGTRPQADDLASQATDGILEMEYGPTLLLQVDAEARADDLLRGRSYAVDRVTSLTLDGTTGDEQMTQALTRQVSDRINLTLHGDDVQQAYYIEGIGHTYAAGSSFQTTWKLSAVQP